MQGFRVCLPARLEHAAALEKISCLCPDEPQSFNAAAKQHVSVQSFGQQHKEGMQQRMPGDGTASQRTAQAGQRDLEDSWETLQRFAACTGDAVARRHQLPVRGYRGACNRDGAQIAAPVGRDDSAQVFIGWSYVACSCAARGSGEYAVREDRAPVLSLIHI